MPKITVNGRSTEDLRGILFSKLTPKTFAGFLGKGAHTFPAWICLCECGTLTPPIFASNLRRGHTESCGCVQKERTSKAKKTHGESAGENCKLRTKEYLAWAGAKQRVTNPNYPRWDRYGGRGIKMCAGFQASFECFLETVGRCPVDKNSLDRRNNSGHYSCGKCEECVSQGWPMNLHWATSLEQVLNRG